MKKYSKVLTAILIAVMLVGTVLASAYYLPGLYAPVAVAISAAGVTSIAVGAVVVAAGYVVYHYGPTVWKYFYASKYSEIDAHAYNIHGSEFENIWPSRPTKTQFDQKCKDNQNDRNNQKYWQYENDRYMSWNAKTEMLSVGSNDGKFVVTCFRTRLAYINNQLATGRWLPIKKY